VPPGRSYGHVASQTRTGWPSWQTGDDMHGDLHGDTHGDLHGDRHGHASASTAAEARAADVGELVRLAGSGDESAWSELVGRYTPMLWAIARSYRLPTADAADVVQIAWLRLLQQLPRIRQPRSVAAWLTTTARRECLLALHRNRREQPHDLGDETFPARASGDAEVDADVDAGLLRVERDEAVRQALAQLSARQQLVLRLLSADPPSSYEEISAATGIPIGSIGPTRARALHRLRTLLERDGILASANANERRGSAARGRVS
jgi:RNA polymerase sigma factor (sigma-70 family)